MRVIPFCLWMEQRISSIEKGLLGVPPEKRPERARYMMARHAPAIRSTVDRQGRADKSDPFARARVASRFRNGVAELDDYGVEFVKVTELSPITGVEFVRMEPRNMKRP